jgi:acetylornithine/succinyldiaminopimelate/putrescine aminotransferase/predicted amino acid dehydrogenase
MPSLNPTRAALLETFALDATMVRGEGARLHDDEGREYLDFLAQYGALPFGHNPAHVWAAINAVQSAALPSMLQPLRAIEAERLADRLAELAPGDLGVVTFANSGAEAVEAAIKLARVRTGRDGILSTLNGFHGKTLGALSATGKPMYQKDFAAPAGGFGYVPYGDLEALEAKLEAEGDRIAAFIVEPIQGEGGVVCPPEGYLDGVIALCRRYGVLSVVDEIQTGLGRTGALFAVEDCEETPDMLLLAKALGGGMMPIAACIARPSAWDDRFGRLHSSTFANNNLACAAANATLDALLEDDRAMIRRVAENGAYLRDRLEALQAAHPDVIREVRGRGYMLGLEFQRMDERCDSAVMAFASLNCGVTPLISSYLLNVRGVLTAPLFNASHVVRLQPPLIAGRAEIDRAIAALEDVCAVIGRRDYQALVRHLIGPERGDRIFAPEAAAAPAPAAPRRLAERRPGSFAFLIHYTEEEDVFRSDPSFRSFDSQELSRWLDWVKRLGPGEARRVGRVVSPAGAEAEGAIMSVPMLPKDMLGKGRKAATAMIREAVGMAAESGVSRVGLGAFTSIVTRGGAAVTGQGAPITSGNTLTTVAAVTAIERVAERVGLRLEDANVAVVGATGAIGRLGALMLARRAGSLTLVGNARNAFAPALLGKVADEVVATLADGSEAASGPAGRLACSVRTAAPRLRAAGDGSAKDLHDRFASAHAARGRPSPLICTTDLRSALARADVVLVATSSEITLVDPTDLRPGTLVCDVARPPSAVDLGPFQTLPTDICWGCLGETMLLALSGQTKDFSIGSELDLGDADLVAALARRHGFAPADTQWYGDRLDERDFDRLAAALRRAPMGRSLETAAVPIAAE